MKKILLLVVLAAAVAYVLQRRNAAAPAGPVGATGPTIDVTDTAADRAADVAEPVGAGTN